MTAMATSSNHRSGVVRAAPAGRGLVERSPERDGIPGPEAQNPLLEVVEGDDAPLHGLDEDRGPDIRGAGRARGVDRCPCR